MAYYVYWITSERRSYVGATVCPTKRLRQHNGELAGGARRTRGRGDWSFRCVVSGFRTWKEALQFEWAFKYHTSRCRCVASRKAALCALMARERWTSNAPPAADVPLEVEYDPTRYGGPPPPAAQPGETTASSAAPCPGARARRKRGWKRSLHGVAY
jgi:predicted GIY-YIG superfamily endonuclease